MERQNRARVEHRDVLVEHDVRRDDRVLVGRQHRVGRDLARRDRGVRLPRRADLLDAGHPADRGGARGVQRVGIDRREVRAPAKPAQHPHAPLGESGALRRVERARESDDHPRRPIEELARGVELALDPGAVDRDARVDPLRLGDGRDREGVAGRLALPGHLRPAGRPGEAPDHRRRNHTHSQPLSRVHPLSLPFLDSHRRRGGAPSGRSQRSPISDPAPGGSRVADQSRALTRPKSPGGPIPKPRLSVQSPPPLTSAPPAPERPDFGPGTYFADVATSVDAPNSGVERGRRQMPDHNARRASSTRLVTPSL